MQKKSQEEHLPEGDKLDRPQMQTMIGEQVMRLLGQPADLRIVHVHKLWEDRYRVNVYVGPNPASAIVAHSYFLVTDGKGNITAANPKITKQY